MDTNTRYLLDEIQYCADSNQTVSLSPSHCAQVMGYIAELENSVANWQDAWKGRRTA